MSKNEDIEVERAKRLYNNLYKKKEKRKKEKIIRFFDIMIKIIIIILIYNYFKNKNDNKKILENTKRENYIKKEKIYNYKKKKIIFAYCEKEKCFIQTDNKIVKTDLSIKTNLENIKYGKYNYIKCKSYKNIWKECEILN